MESFETLNIGYVAKKYPYTTLMTWEFYKHKHSFWEFVIVLDGKATHLVNDEKHVLKYGDVLIMKPDSIHDYKILANEPYAHYDFYASTADLKRACDSLNKGYYSKLVKDKSPLVFNADEQTLKMLELKLSKLNSMQLNQNLTELTQTLYYTILHFICGVSLENQQQQTSNLPEWLSDLLSKMSHPSFICGSVEDIVKISHFSHTHLCKLFKKYMNETLQEYFTKLKLDYSTLLLKNKDMSVLEISLNLGYDSVSHFIKLFKKYNGITPKQYQKRLYI